MAITRISDKTLISKTLLCSGPDLSYTYDAMQNEVYNKNTIVAVLDSSKPTVEDFYFLFPWLVSFFDVEPHFRLIQLHRIVLLSCLVLNVGRVVV